MEKPPRGYPGDHKGYPPRGYDEGYEMYGHRGGRGPYGDERYGMEDRNRNWGGYEYDRDRGYGSDEDQYND